MRCDVEGQSTPPLTQSVKDLVAFYKAIELGFVVRANSDYETLVVANGNSNEPIHRWFRLKEAYSRRLLPRLIKDLGIESKRDLRILDPFAGSGTTAISAADLVMDKTLAKPTVVSFECNPFLQLVSSSKLRALQQPTTSFLTLAKRVGATAGRRRIEPAAVPSLATFENREFFDSDGLTKLLRLRAAIDEAAHLGESQLDIDLARVCLGASIEPASSLRRDGRALRHVPDKVRADPITEFLRRAEQVDEDMPRRPIGIRGSIHLGDGRSLRPNPPRAGSVDLVVFSPPYPNNIDYTEVYKMEAWLLGFITTSREFTDQRLRTLYSHPSVLRPTAELDSAVGVASDFASMMAPVLAAIPPDRYHSARHRMLNGYFADMLVTLRSSFAALSGGGDLVYVVGNSVHGSGDESVVIAADLLIARLAEVVGFEVRSIEVARQLRRRQIESPFLRESVVFLRRPSP